MSHYVFAFDLLIVSGAVLWNIIAERRSKHRHG